MDSATTPLHHVLGLVFPGRCPGCGRPAEPICAACARAARRAPACPPPPGLDAWVAVFAYDGVARELVARAKYRGRHAVLPWLARRMVDAWVAAGAGPPDVVTWAPTATPRRRARGFDHARALARAVARGLDCCAVPLLARAAGPPQTGRPLDERRLGPVVRARRRVRGTVLVVDDVSTTGATLRACAVALRAAGADRVVGLTAARTPPPRARR